jgi:hypothetical protein
VVVVSVAAGEAAEAVADAGGSRADLRTTIAGAT